MARTTNRWVLSRALPGTAICAALASPACAARHLHSFFQPRDGVSLSTIRWQGQELINFSGYNYLGLSGHPHVSAAAKMRRSTSTALRPRPAASSRGQIDLHNELERRLAAFIGAEDAIYSSSAATSPMSPSSATFDATRRRASIYGFRVHNSILTGARLSGRRGDDIIR